MCSRLAEIVAVMAVAAVFISNGAAARVECDVKAVSGTSIELTKPLAADVAATGAYLLAQGTGYEIEAVEGNVIRVRD